MRISSEGVRYELVPIVPDPPDTPGASAGSPSAPGAAVSFARALDGIGSAVDRGEALIARATGGALTGLDSAQLIALQAGIYRYSEAVDLTAKLVDRTTSALLDFGNGRHLIARSLKRAPREFLFGGVGTTLFAGIAAAAELAAALVAVVVVVGIVPGVYPFGDSLMAGVDLGDAFSLEEPQRRGEGLTRRPIAQTDPGVHRQRGDPPAPRPRRRVRGSHSPRASCVERRQNRPRS